MSLNPSQRGTPQIGTKAKRFPSRFDEEVWIDNQEWRKGGESLRDRFRLQLWLGALGRRGASFACPSRRALLEERREPFLEILRGSDLRALRGGQFDFAVDFRSGKIAEEFLGQVKARRTAFEQGSRKHLRRNH